MDRIDLPTWRQHWREGLVLLLLMLACGINDIQA